MAADFAFLALLVLHVGSIVAWMGGAALFVSVIMPSLRKMSPPARGEFVLKAVPGYLRFIAGSSVVGVLAGVILYAYITVVNTDFAPSSSGAIYIQAGAVLGLVVVVIALGVLVPAGRKMVALVGKMSTSPPAPGGQDTMAAQMAGLQRRMGIGARVGLTLLALILILMLIGANIT